MAIANQGYRRDLDLLETPNDFTALDNLGGVGISFDLQIIQNNLLIQRPNSEPIASHN